jgi:SAM-dependent methyltransferase
MQTRDNNVTALASTMKRWTPLGWLPVSWQYRVIKALAPVESPPSAGEDSYDEKKLRILLGESFFLEIIGKTVIDFGCGEGRQSSQIAKAGADRVYGLDIQPRYLEAARREAERSGCQDICEFREHLPDSIQADIVVSIDSFEHFGDPERVLREMKSIMKPGGVLVVSFGPPWYHPLGGHLFSIFPWAHLVFSEEALIRWRSDVRSDGATRFGEVAGGLNQMTIARFERTARESGLAVEKLEVAPIRALRWLHCGLTREFTSSLIRARLRKSA